MYNKNFVIISNIYLFFGSLCNIVFIDYENIEQQSLPCNIKNMCVNVRLLYLINVFFYRTWNSIIFMIQICAHKFFWFLMASFVNLWTINIGMVINSPLWVNIHILLAENETFLMNTVFTFRVFATIYELDGELKKIFLSVTHQWCILASQIQPAF